MSVKAKYDTEEVVLSQRFVDALIELMMAKCEMFGGGDPDCWTWGRCCVIDLAYSDGLSFHYGGDDDMPDDGLGRFAVLAGKK